MIHQVRASLQDVEILRQIVDLQLAILSLAANTSSVDKSTDSTHGNLEIALRGLFQDDGRASKTASWITRTQKLLEPLNGFASHTNLEEKQGFVEQIKADISLIYKPKQAKLKVAITDKSPSWQLAAKNFLLEFYDIFGTERGFPSYLFISQDYKASYRRWEFIDGFTAINPHLRLCAVCDSTLYRTTIGDRPYTSIEHFFPKSRYPHLAVHPYNLIPICPFCNSIARDIDPFGEDEDNLGVKGLVLPYQNQPGLNEQVYIYVKPHSDRERHPFELEMLPNQHYPDIRTLVGNFERIYQVQDRWNKDIEWIDQHVFKRITQFLTADVQAGNKIEDPRFLIDRFQLLMAVISKENLGQDPFGFAVIWLIKYHIDSLQNSLTSPECVPIYAAITHWAQGQQKRWKEYREHATEIIRRVPADSA